MWSQENHRDFGLTAVSCMGDERNPLSSYLICSSTDGGWQMLHSFDEQSHRSSPITIGQPDYLGRSIHQAIGLSQGTPTFMMLNEHASNLHVLRLGSYQHRWVYEKVRLRSAPPSYSSNERPLIHLAATTAAEVYVCCVDRGEAKVFCYNTTQQSNHNVEPRVIQLTPFLST